ncbi:tetratricopeptide repeat protein [Thomasclavelia cocleata]|uniref:tetratricopeptide repeat protein n=1 Tax=Thomasclavelia cocleata TaxID=69824 RepID=UPI00255AE81A|nr:tetratricopeptide repeat protein [Thomasclavelia cocleata]
MNCFIIMGFNIKTGEDGKEYNLNISYEEIIKPVLDKLNIDYIRADELMTSDLIDESMYKLLLSTDLVIADITTLNPNALYELGIRYALKPFSTIIICRNGTNLPFDINHMRVFMYKHGGNYISYEEVKRMIDVLTKIINNIKNNTVVDSPVYKFIENLTPPRYKNDNDYFKVTTQRFKAGDNLCNLINTAYKLRDKGNFEKAIKYYKKALKIAPDEYIVKEIATCLYQNDVYQSYIDALIFIKQNVDIKETKNPEILKCIGTIYKNLWMLDESQIEYAKESLNYYEKSFVIFNAYNSGLNYGFMLLVLSDLSEDKNEAYMYRMWAKHIYSKTRDICVNKYELSDYWVNASLEECYLALEDTYNYEKYNQLSLINIKLLSKDMIWKRKKTEKQLNYIKRILFK